MVQNIDWYSDRCYFAWRDRIWRIYVLLPSNEYQGIRR